MPDVLQLALKGESVVLRQINEVIDLALQVSEVVPDDYFVSEQAFLSSLVLSSIDYTSTRRQVVLTPGSCFSSIFVSVQCLAVLIPTPSGTSNLIPYSFSISG